MAPATGRPAEAQKGWTDVSLNRTSAVILVAAAFILLLWQGVNHLWLMSSSMGVFHSANLAMAAVVVSGAALLVEGLFRKHSANLESINAKLASHAHELEVAYRHLQNLEAQRENLTHMIVHDMRGPLTEVVGFVELAQGDATDENRQKWLAHVRNGGDRLGRMVQNLLDISRMESGQLALNLGPLDIGELARQVIDDAALQLSQAEVDVDCHLIDLPIEVVADREILQRVLGNLLTNAIKFSPSHQSILVSACRDPQRGEVVVALEDHGPGISEEHHGRIFEKFQQVGARDHGVKAGVGLGLAFCKLAMEAHGGRIEVDSQAGKGSTFSIHLPLLHIAHAAAE